MLSFGLYSIALLMVVYLYFQLQLPGISHIKHIQLQVPLRIYTHDEKLIAIFGEKYCFPVSFEKIPTDIVNALVATEDHRFYQHVGIDFVSLLRAAHVLIQTGEKREGGSTITMQVARNFFLNQRKSYSRKIKEILLALKIDRLLSKNQILELYLNRVYFGHRAYGIAAAATIYYGKALNDLTLAEMAMLVGLPQAPSRINPLFNADAAIKRRNHVLKRMLAMDYITEKAYQKAYLAPITASRHLPQIDFQAPYIAEMARLYAEHRWGKDAYTRNIKIYTTVNSTLQIAAQEALISGIKAYEVQRRSYELENNPNSSESQAISQDDLQGAIVALDPNQGAILALVGGLNKQGHHFNRITQAKRQAASTIKPFIYSAALAKGLTLATIINDAPIVTQGGGNRLLWRPHNVNEQFNGPTRLRVGLVHSRNLVSIRLLKRMNIKETRNYLARFGFDLDTLPNSLSLALGSNLISPLKLAAAYAVFANTGFRIHPHFIARIEEEGQVLPPDPNNSAKRQRVITAQNAYLITQALRSVIHDGSGRRAKVLERDDIAGKTGSSNNQLDAWFAGFQPNLLAVAWMGYDHAISLHMFASQTALPIWINFMRKALQQFPPKVFPRPPGLITVRIDPETGLLAYPQQPNAIFEIFRRQHVPTLQVPYQDAPTSIPEDDLTHNGNPPEMPDKTLLENLF